MIYDPAYWSAPAYALNTAIEREKQAISSGITLSSEERKAAKEIKAVSILALGINKMTGDSYRLQLVDPRDQAPDLRTMRYVEGPGVHKPIEYQDVEVVTLDDNSPDSIVPFLQRTKLNDKKVYQEGTIILCHIDKTISGSTSWQQIHEELKGLDKPIEVYLLAKTSPTAPAYLAAMVYPSLANVVEFNVMDEAKRNRMVGTLITKRRPTDPDISLPRGITPFDDSASLPKLI